MLVSNTNLQLATSLNMTTHLRMSVGLSRAIKYATLKEPNDHITQHKCPETGFGSVQCTP